MLARERFLFFSCSYFCMKENGIENCVLEFPMTGGPTKHLHKRGCQNCSLFFTTWRCFIFVNIFKLPSPPIFPSVQICQVINEKKKVDICESVCEVASAPFFKLPHFHTLSTESAWQLMGVWFPRRFETFAQQLENVISKHKISL